MPPVEVRGPLVEALVKRIRARCTGQLGARSIVDRLRPPLVHQQAEALGELPVRCEVIETAREYRNYNTGKGIVTGKSERDISVDSLPAFVRRVSEGKPENVGVCAAESTLTALLGQIACYQKREIACDEMMASACASLQPALRPYFSFALPISIFRRKLWKDW